jgi:hypothetical protein
MRYVRLEKATTKYIDGKKTVHETTYSDVADCKYGAIRWQHIAENTVRLGWDSYEVFVWKGDYWFWNNEAYGSFSQAYEASKKGIPHGNIA